MMVDGTHYDPHCSCKNCKLITKRNNYMTKQPKWEEEFDKKLGDYDVNYNFGVVLRGTHLESEIKQFITKTLKTQEEEHRKELEELEKHIEGYFKDNLPGEEIHLNQIKCYFNNKGINIK